MTVTWTPLLMMAAGHFCLTIGILNWSQGHGYNVKWMDQLILAGLGLAGLLFLFAAWMVWNLPFPNWPVLIQAYAALCAVILVVVLPLSTFVRHVRPEAPGTLAVSSSTHDLGERFGKECLIGHSGAGRLLRLPGNDSLKLARNEWSVTLQKLPPALDGLTILHLTDLHFAHSFRQRFFEEVVNLAMEGAPEPDLVLITGDFLDHDDTVAWVEPVLGRLKARLGKIAVLGNHDYRHDFRGLRRGLRKADFRTLDGRWMTLETERGCLVLGGTSYPWGRHLDPARMPEGDVRILLSHAPDQVYRASDWSMDFMLCGHNHGGQVRIPVLGPILMPSRYGRRFDQGFYRVGPTTMFVGTGVGGKHPIRFRCQPEVTRITLRSSAEFLALQPHHRGSFAKSQVI